MQLAIYEIFQIVNATPSRQERIKHLRDNINKPLLEVLLGIFDHRVKWMLPSGHIDFTPGPSKGAEVNLAARTRTFYLYTEGGGAPEGLSQAKRIITWIQLLEGVHPKDAVILNEMKDKHLPSYPNITFDLIDEAFPNFLDKPLPGQATAQVERSVWTAPSGPPVPKVPAAKEAAPAKRGRGRPSKKALAEAAAQAAAQAAANATEDATATNE
jgi:hypothetical protein